MKKIIIILLLLFPIIAIAQTHRILGIDEAKRQLRAALNDTSNWHANSKDIITNKETAIAIAEPILFDKYGKDHIINERPYEAYLINGYWVLNGTIPTTDLGGGFLIILSAKDSRVVKLTHFK